MSENSFEYIIKQKAEGKALAKKRHSEYDKKAAVGKPAAAVWETGLPRPGPPGGRENRAQSFHF